MRAQTSLGQPSGRKGASVSPTTDLDAPVRAVPALGAVVVKLRRVELLGALLGLAVGVPPAELAVGGGTRVNGWGVSGLASCIARQLSTYPRLLVAPPLLDFCLTSPNQQSSYVYSPRSFSTHVPSSFFHSPSGPNFSAMSAKAVWAELKAVWAVLSDSSAWCKASREAGVPAQSDRSRCQRLSRAGSGKPAENNAHGWQRPTA